MQKYIHETVLRDVIDIVEGLKKYDAIDSFMNRKNGNIKSINDAAAGQVLVFPVIVSNNLSIDTAQMMTKSIERKAVSLLRILFSAIQVTNDATLSKYLKQFHNNLDIDMVDFSVENILDLTDKYLMENTILKEGTDYIKINQYDISKQLNKDYANSDLYLEDSINENAIGDFKINNGTDVVLEYDNIKAKSAITKSMNDTTKYLSQNLLDNDVKKANELVETQMVVNVTYQNEEGAFLPLHLIIGIKAKMHPVNSMDIIDRLVIKNKDNNFFMKLIQTTTREISFFKDFLLGIERSKLDAISVSSKYKKSSVLWKVLERRAKKSKLKRVAGLQNDAMSITTLVVSQSEVEYLKTEHNINIEEPKVIRKIMESYNLMSVVIADESSEIGKFIFDNGSDLYEHISFRSLERESSDRDYKKLVNLMAKNRY